MIPLKSHTVNFVIIWVGLSNTAGV
jgi:hypothetical protein